MSSPFDPAPALPGWNYDYTSDLSAGVRSYFDKRVVNMYTAAVNERLKAMSADPALLLPTAVTDDLIGNAWTSICGTVNDQLIGLGPFIQAYDAGGSPLTYYTSNFVPGDEDLATFVWSILKRRYPREILTLTSTNSTNADVVTNGQKARLVGASTTYGSNTGRIFLRTAGAWAIDAAALPDVVTHDLYADGGPAGATYRPSSGDYFVALFLNELRDLINQLVATMEFTNSWDAYFAPGGGSGASNVSMAAAIADYNANATNVVSTTTVGHGPYISITASGFPVQYQVNGDAASPRVNSLPMAGICSYQVFFFALASKTGRAGPIDVFEPYATTYVENDYVPLGASGVISTSSFVGGIAGYPTAPPAGSPYPSPGAGANGWIFTSDSGFEVLGVIVRYDVSGGFAYTKYT